MYEKFYGLAEPPFNLTPDSRFLFPSHHHREAMGALLYGIRERKGFTLLTGEIGSGKTTLCRALVKELDGTATRVVLILDSFVNEIELLQTINEELGIDASAPTRKGLIDTLSRYLIEQHAGGTNVAVLIDEAQNLSDGVLEQIRMLGNLETEQHKLLQIVLIGQPELQTAILDPKLEQLNQRIAVRYHLRPLESDEIEPYIHHRLRVAGLSTPLEVLPEALDLIYEFTSGVPRKINLLCDRALLAGYVASTTTIDDAIIRSAATEVGADQWAAPTQAGQESAPRPGALRRPSSATLIYALTLIVLLAVIPVLLSESGLWNRWFGSSPPGGPDPLLPDNLTTPTQIIPPKPTPEPRDVAPPEPTPPVDDAATESFQLARPKLAAPWTYDDDLVVRVDQAEFCRTAAILTLLAAWGIEVNLEDFRALTVEDAQRVNVIEANREMGLRSAEIKGGLARALIYDLPVVVQIADPEERLSDYVCLLNVSLRRCRIADPMMGVQEVPRSLFESFWRQAWVVYFDPDGLDALALGERSERARVLQQALSDLGFYRGTITGEFDRATVNAVKYLQRYFDVFPTGRLDPLTIMLLTAHRQPDRPRLTVEKEQGP